MKNYRKVIGVFTIFFVLAFYIVLTGEIYRISEERAKIESYLYIPSGKFSKLVSFGNEELLSDFYLSQALIYFGSHYYKRKTYKFSYLYDFFNGITEIDPLNEEAYLMGARLLSDIYPEKAIELLIKGEKNLPQSWRISELAGFISYYQLKNRELAAKFYEIASRKPGRPPYVPSLSSKFYREAGDLERAILVLEAFYLSSKDKRLKKGFKEDIEELKTELYFLKKARDGVVLRIHDGDTFTIRFSGGAKRKVRLLGVNSYELNEKDSLKKLFAFIAKDFGYYKLKGKKVRVAVGGDIFDRHGRMLVYLWYGETNKFYNYELVYRGYAKAFLKYKFEKPFMRKIEYAQFLAKANKRGLWGWKYLKPYPAEVSKNLIGYPAKVKFKVLNIYKKTNYILLESSMDWKNCFKAYVTKRALINDREYFLNLYGKEIIVSGFVTSYRGSPEIRVYFKEQIERVK